LLYSLKGADLSAKTAVLTSNRGIISALAYSPNTASHHLAVGDTDRKVLVYDTATGEVVLNQWVFHTARVNCVAWTDCGKHAVSGGLDRNVYVWSVDNPMKSIAIKGNEC
jgi:WD40 repeat protein